MKKKFEKYFPPVLLGLCLLFLAGGLKSPQPINGFDLKGYGDLPALNGGRVKPLDSVARTSLLVLSGKQNVRHEGQKIPAIQWMLDTMYAPQKANDYKVIEINDPDVLGLMDIEQTTQRRFSMNELLPHFDVIRIQAESANNMESENRSRYQNAILQLHSRINLYQRLQNTLQVEGSHNLVEELRSMEGRLFNVMATHMNMTEANKEDLQEAFTFVQKYRFIDEFSEFDPIPVAQRDEDGFKWVSFGRGALNLVNHPELDQRVLAYAQMGAAYHKSDPFTFNKVLIDLQAQYKAAIPNLQAKVHYEALFNRLAPFYRSIVLYTLVFLLAFFAWLFMPKTLRKSAFQILILAFVVHTLGLLSRMVLQGRPPVTNLYSSAIFVGWVAVLLGIILERIFKRGIGLVLSSVIGIVTLIIAHHLSSQGDTLEMMRAVLDSNFWLATHVITITIGYSSTFISGMIGIIYLIRRIFDKSWNQESALVLSRMLYGVVCFSTFFSFLGTVLGGIWADQSWGRFWGWDPKENGALMIVLWNVLMLHARWGKVVSERSLMMMAVFGNVITALSWFGVNMLGIGLHSYGFMDKAFVWLMIFTASQLALMGLGWVRPLDRSKSRSKK